MRDLYKRLGVDVFATEDEIRRAVEESRDAELCTSVRAILLVRRNRAHYDACHRSLSAIGEIRVALGVQAGGHWSARCADFVVSQSALAILTPKDLRAVSRRPMTWRRLISSQPARAGGCLIFLVAAIAVARWRADRLYTERADEFERTTLLDVAPTVAFDEPPVAEPTTGILSTALFGAPEAPLEIRTRKGGGSMLVKVTDVASGTVAVEAFVREGDTCSLEVPLGAYHLKYAAGRTWYGMKHLFGPETVYSRADKVFEFTRTKDGVRGYTVELFLQPNGNMATRRISASQF